jgi:hypothetical protein
MWGKVDLVESDQGCKLLLQGYFFLAAFTSRTPIALLAGHHCNKIFVSKQTALQRTVKRFMCDH